MRRPLFCALAGIAAAVWITILFFPWEPPDYEPFRNERVRMTGVVCGLEPKREGEDIVWQMLLSDVTVLTDVLPAGSSPGKRARVLCVLDREPALEMSAHVRVSGTLIPFRPAYNEGEFDYRLYEHILRVEYSLRDVRILAASNPTDPMAASLYHFKRITADTIDRIFSTRNSPVLHAMLLGEKGLLEEETKQLYQDAGIIHILSVSGLHLSLLGMGLFSLLEKLRLPRAACAGAAVPVLILYGRMIGMGTSVFRAVVMLSLYITAKVIGRTYDLLTAAGIACILLLFDQPLYLLHTGFQFSFAAVLSMGILMPALPAKLRFLAVPVGTLPVYLQAYGTFPFWSLLLNLLVIPLMGFVMTSSACALLAGGLLSLLTHFPVPGDPAGLTELTKLARLTEPGNGILMMKTDGGLLDFIPRLIGFPAEVILDLCRLLASIIRKLPGNTLVIGSPSNVRTAAYYLMLLMLSAVSAYLKMPPVRRRVETLPYRTGVSFPHRPGMNTARCTGFQRADRRGHREDGRDVFRNIRSMLRSSYRRISQGRSTFHRSSHRRISLRRISLIGIVQTICVRLRLVDNRSRRRFGSLCVMIWAAAAVLVLTTRVPPVFEMDILYVGQGDGICIQCGNRNFLIDGGSTTKEKLSEYTLLPYLHCRGIRRLDGMILTHDDRDHCSGMLEILEAAAEGDRSLSIGRIYLPAIAREAAGENYRRIEELASQAGIPVSYISRGQRIHAGDLTMDCLHPSKNACYEEANAYSTTLLVRFRGFSALLTGDLEGQGETDFLEYLETGGAMPQDSWEEQLLRPTILKVAHHGSRNATSEAFLRQINPQTTVISAGYNNMYGHPHAELLERLQSAPSPPVVFRTDLSGETMVRWRPTAGKEGVDALPCRISTFLEDH